MIKQLDKLIIKSFLGPFIATFFIAFFILMMQNVWKYIDDLVGKGLDLVTIGKFVWYVSATMLTLAMPIAILFSTIMTFGNLGESFELVAIKSSGISLLRFMRPLLVIAVFLCSITFLIANYIIPYATLKFNSLYYDIRVKKPALDLKEGVFFNHIPNYVIKVGKKDKDGKTIRNVIIYEQNNQLQDNCIVADSGIMNVTNNDKYLEFNLKNGYRYQERGNIGDTSTEFIRVGFKEYVKLVDLSSFALQNSNDSFLQKNFKMQNVVQLNHSIDSLTKLKDSTIKNATKLLNTYLHYGNMPDSIWKRTSTVKTYKKEAFFSKQLPDSERYLVLDRAVTTVNGLKSSYQSSSAEVVNRTADLRYHQMEWHRKFSLSLACLVLFFIGAPLGSIIRKGGLGMPLVAAIVMFLIFHLLNMFGEKFVKNETMSPFIGMWLAVLVLIPIGFFLTYKAMHDSQLFNKDYYLRIWQKIRSVFVKAKTV